MRLKGEISASNFILISDKAQELYRNPARNLIIDLSEVPAIHKIALLYSGVPQNVEQDANPDFTHSSNARKHVRLVNPQPSVDRDLEAAGLKMFFKVFNDLDSAIASFQ